MMHFNIRLLLSRSFFFFSSSSSSFVQPFVFMHLRSCSSISSSSDRHFLWLGANGKSDQLSTWLDALATSREAKKEVLREVKQGIKKKNVVKFVFFFSAYKSSHFCCILHAYSTHTRLSPASLTLGHLYCTRNE